MLFGLSTVFVFMFKIEWLHNNKTFLYFAVYCCFLFLLSYFIESASLHINEVAALRMPLVSALIFFLLASIFKKAYNREPKNTFYSFTKQHWTDVVFSILFWILGVGIPMFLLL